MTLVRVTITTGVVKVAPEKRGGNGRNLRVELHGTGESGSAGEEDDAFGLREGGREGGKEDESGGCINADTSPRKICHPSRR